MRTYVCDNCGFKTQAEDLPEGWTNDKFYLCKMCSNRNPNDFCPHCVAVAWRDFKHFYKGVKRFVWDEERKGYYTENGEKL